MLDEAIRQSDLDDEEEDDEDDYDEDEDEDYDEEEEEEDEMQNESAELEALEHIPESNSHLQLNSRTHINDLNEQRDIQSGDESDYQSVDNSLPKSSFGSALIHLIRYKPETRKIKIPLEIIVELMDSYVRVTTLGARTN